MAQPLNKALFLDRDGVINIDIGYAYQPESITFMADIFTLCQQAIKAGYLIIIVTNQSGIARGYYSEQDFHALSQWMTTVFAEHDIAIKAIYHCPHHPAITGECTCRKPQAGMLLKAIEEFNIDPISSVMIGDNLSDMQAAKAAKIATRLLFTPQTDVTDDATAHIQHLQQASNYL